MSKQNARPCNVDWIRSLKDQCKAADVPCFVKQLGSRPVLVEGLHSVARPCGGREVEANPISAVLQLRDKKGGDWNEWPEALKVMEFYKS